MKQRINWIDWAKSVCMFLVILGHCHLCESQQIITQVIYSFHIPLFFFLSGILCPKRFSLETLKKDLKYIIVPYFTYGMLLAILNSIISKELSLEYYLQSLLALCYGNDINIGPIWFLPALFICKQFYYLFQWIGEKSIIAHTILIVFSFLFTFFIGSYDICLPLFADSGFFGLPFFLIGSMSLTWISERLSDKTPLLPTVIVLFAITICLSVFNDSVNLATCNYGNYLALYYLNAFAGISFIIGICLLLNPYINRFTTITSYGTIVILGIHGPILRVLQYYLPVYLGYYTTTINLMTALFYASVTQFICYIIILWADRYCPLLLGLKGKLTKSFPMT